jgi:hypothetical protein
VLWYCNRIVWHSTLRFYKKKDIMACYSRRKSHRLGFPTLENMTSWIHGGPMIWLPRFLTLHPVISSSGGKKDVCLHFPIVQTFAGIWCQDRSSCCYTYTCEDNKHMELRNKDNQLDTHFTFTFTFTLVQV